MTGSSSLCPDHLLVRVRAGALSGAERDVLDAHLEQCGACRVALGAGQAFDRVLGPQPGDDQIAARLWSEVERQVLPRRSRRGRTVVAVAAAAVLILLSVTAVAMLPGLRAELGRRLGLALGKEPPNAGARAPAPRSAPGPGPVTGAPTPSDRPAETPTSSAREEEPVGARDGRAPSSAPAPKMARASESAGALFSAANASRRRGDTGRAVDQYRRLEQRYPSSPEALVAHVALGRLLLAPAGTGAARGALAEFDAYLAAAPAAPLAEEALFGRASCLLRLGRGGEEAATWRQLLERFPHSVYAERARVRLGELSP